MGRLNFNDIAVKYTPTRGQWLQSELKWAVLRVALQQSCEEEEGYFLPPLTAYRIWQLTGGNYISIRVLLKKWSCGRDRVLDRTKWGGLYVYSITARGYRCLEMLTEGYISRRHHKWVQVDAKAVLRRLPAYRAVHRDE